MRTKVIEATVRRPRASKYGKLLAAMSESLARDGADGRLRAVEGTAVWSAAKKRRWVRGVRCYYQTHRITGYRLSLGTCITNGVVFRWQKVG